jgi:hypothetical protein
MHTEMQRTEELEALYQRLRSLIALDKAEGSEHAVVLIQEMQADDMVGLMWHVCQHHGEQAFEEVFRIIPISKDCPVNEFNKTLGS